MVKLVRRFPSKAKTTDDTNTPQESTGIPILHKRVSYKWRSPGILYLRSLDTRSDNYCCLSYLLLNSIILVTGIFCELQFKASVHCKLCMHGKAESFYYANNDNSLFYLSLRSLYNWVSSAEKFFMISVRCNTSPIVRSEQQYIFFSPATVPRILAYVLYLACELHVSICMTYHLAGLFMFVSLETNLHQTDQRRWQPSRPHYPYYKENFFQGC